MEREISIGNCHHGLKVQTNGPLEQVLPKYTAISPNCGVLSRCCSSTEIYRKTNSRKSVTWSAVPYAPLLVSLIQSRLEGSLSKLGVPWSQLGGPWSLPRGPESQLGGPWSQLGGPWSQLGGLEPAGRAS